MTNSGERPAIVLASGGLDSTTVLAMAREAGHTVHALSFDYGQRHRFELDAAGRVAEALGATSRRIVRVELGPVGGSALTADIPVPKGREAEQMSDGIPITYVPARNTVFLSYALAWAEVLDAADIFIGVNAVDYSGYPDCRPEFIEAFERMANLATQAAVEGRLKIRIHAPLIQMTKAEIIRTGIALGVDYGMTHSCYDPDDRGRACGQCESCRLRRRGFQEAGVDDPTWYAE
ncbi:MAG: 7-cyano-7-deazaguanine synthase QueC [Desulfococcaceae bacterium]